MSDDIHAPPSEYYSGPLTLKSAGIHRSRSRNYQASIEFHNQPALSLPSADPSPPHSPGGEQTPNTLRRRGSLDDKTRHPRRFLVDIATIERAILDQEDTNGDYQITVEDSGPKVLKVPTAGSGGNRTMEIRGTYMLSNLLQEMALAKDHGLRQVVIDEDRLSENPVSRLSRMIRTTFWNGLVRCMDEAGIQKICADPKNTQPGARPIIYVPHGDPDALEYYTGVARDLASLHIDVVRLPREITPQYVKSINKQFGILTLAADVSRDANGRLVYKPLPFVVPGGRFNEQYGWDSYFEALGLLCDGRVQLAKNMVDNFVYEIKHYGKILNANRSYYLTRSQPPFLTDMAIKVHDAMAPGEERDEWLRHALSAAITEYHEVWMSLPRLDATTGLSCYHPTGIGMPPETESTHFDHIVQPYADRLGVTADEYKRLYQADAISEPELDAYFVHDRAVRESGHDTTYRLDQRCAHLATVDLNSLLYRYEADLASAIETHFGGQMTQTNGQVSCAAAWRERAATRRAAMDRYLWNEEKGLYFDYDVELAEQSKYESVTALWALWAGCASTEQAARLVDAACRRFEAAGGLVSGTEESRGRITLLRPNRQWDYPYGWAPHQMLAWSGLYSYGYASVARRLAYRWLFTITRAFVDFNGVVPEKFDVVGMTHRFHVEYGNVGVDFRMVPREGFGWMNASYQVGLTYLTSHMRRALGALTEPEVFFSRAGWSTDASASHTPACMPCPVPAFAAADARRNQMGPSSALHSALEAALSPSTGYFDLPLTGTTNEEDASNPPLSPASSTTSDSTTV
ncbi:alpha,alpha-trehalase nth1 [Coemansia aciculifera]|uniref:Alpha,alpha-trehalase nth1 n=1 Tax=Coemansia aciculifera TaxID=417176 RepID=A0ACC1M9D4_9FUNG|nr:alpha,alpha-trehalase nth1 [Coemansia aciculifera]